MTDNVNSCGKRLEGSEDSPLPAPTGRVRQTAAMAAIGAMLLFPPGRDAEDRVERALRARAGAARSDRPRRRPVVGALSRRGAF